MLTQRNKSSTEKGAKKTGEDKGPFKARGMAARSSLNNKEINNMIVRGGGKGAGGSIPALGGFQSKERRSGSMASR